MAAKLNTFKRLNIASIASSAIVIFVLFVIAFFLFSSTQANLESRGIDSGFDFLSREAGLPIGDSLVEYAPTKSYAYAFYVGFLNTVLVSVLAIIFATILGIIVGVSRVSKNWIVAKIAAVYVQTLRNVPLLLILLFLYSLILNSLPSPKNAISPIDGLFLTQRGLYFPKPIGHEGIYMVIWMFVASIIASLFYVSWARKYQDRTGKQLPYGWIALLIVAGVSGLTFLVMGMPLSFEYAFLKGFGFKGGLSIKPEFSTLLIGLTLYTAAYIGENVRSGIQSVTKGQIEAANALGVPTKSITTRILLPQALRVTIPATTNDYASLVKNSSLAVAIGFPDMVSIGGTVIGQNGQAIEVIAIWMAIYMAINMLVSVAMNWLNNRVQIVER